MATLDAKARGALDDSSFAYIDSKGNKKLPIQDVKHVRNALSRFNQTQFESASAKATARRKILAAAKKFKIDVSEDFNEGEPLLVGGPRLEFSFAEGKPIPFVKVGEFDFDEYGHWDITPDDLDHMAQTFRDDARRQDLPIKAEHDGPGAVGWISDMYVEGDTLFAVPDWNPAGERLIAEDRFRAVSPEILRVWTDPESLDTFEKVPAGLALTSYPKMKGLTSRGAPLAASEVLAFSEGPIHIDRPLTNMSVAYAFPRKNKLPLNSAAQVKGSAARFGEAADEVEASDEEKANAWTAIQDAAKRFGVSLPAKYSELTPGAVRQLLVAAETDGMDGDGDVDFDDYPCPNDGSEMEMVSVEMYCPDCGARTTYRGPKWATFAETQTHSHADQGGQMSKANEGTDTKANEGTEGKTAEELKASEAKVAEGQATADKAEAEALLAAEKADKKELATRLLAAEKEGREAKAEVRALQAATRLAGIQDRLTAAVKSGRVTPAEMEKYGENLAVFTEHEFLLDAIEARPENSAIPFGEKGTEGRGAENMREDEKLHMAAVALMSERNQKLSDKGAYRQALLDATQQGFRG